MASDVLLIPDRGEIRWIDETVSPQSMSLLGNSQNQLNFVGYTSAFDANQTPTGGTTRVTINDSTTDTLVPGTSGSELGSSALRWSLSATSINATGQLVLSTTGSGAGILIGGDAQIYRDIADVLRTPDSWRIDGSIGINEAAPTAARFSASNTNTSLSSDYTTAQSIAVHTINSPDTTTSRTWAMKFTATQNGSGIFNDASAYGATGLEGSATFAGTGTSVGVTGIGVVARNNSTGTLTRANGVAIAMTSVNTGGGHITNLRPLDIAWATDFSANNQTRMAIRIGPGPTNAGSYSGSIVGGIWFNSSAGTAVDGIIWGTSGDTNLYRSAANILATDDNFEIRGGLALRLRNPANTKESTLAAGTQTVVVNYTLPTVAPSTNDVLMASSVSGTDPVAVALGWTSLSGGGITSLGGQTGATQTFANDTNVTISSATNVHTLGWTGQLAVSRGGTGAGTFTSNGVLLGNGTSAISVTAAGTANQVLRVPGGGGSPAFGAIDLAQSAAVTGTLGVANGGTGTGTTFTTGSVVFAGASGVYSQDNANFFWDNTNKRLGLGTPSAVATLHVNPATGSQSSWLTDGAFLNIQSGTRTNSSTAGSGTAASAVFSSFGQPTLAATNSSVTTTDAATVYIANAPTAGSNMTITSAYALWVDDGSVRLDGQLLLPATGSGAGVLIGGDVQLYRSGANILGIPDVVEIRSGNALRFNNSGDTKFSSFAPGAQTVTVDYTLPAAAPALNDVLKATAVSGTDPVTVTLGWAAGASGGITSLGGQTGATQTFANDTNVTISSVTDTHTLGWTGQLAVSRGGTGAGTFTSNGVLLGNGTSALGVTAAGTANQVLRIPGGGGSPAFGAIDLAQSAAVTGILGVTNGGTGTGTQFTQHNIVFAGASGVYSQSSNFTYNTSTGQFTIATTGSGAGILIGGDAQIYRDAADVLRTPDSLRIDGSIGINEAAPTASRLSANHTNTSQVADYTTIQSAATHTINSPDTTTSRTWAMKFVVTQNGSGIFNDASSYGATGLEGTATFAGTGTSVGVTGGAFLARNTSTGTLTRANGVVIAMASVNTGGGHITNLRPLDITWATNFSANNQTRMAIRIGTGPTNAGSFSGSIVGGIWFNSNSGIAVDGILWGTSGDTNLYRSAANILATDDNFEIRGGLALRLLNPANTKESTFAAGAQAVVINYTLPTTAPSTNDVLKATVVSGTDPVTVTLGWAADTDTGITSLGGQTGTTQTFANDTNVTISSAANTHTLGWTGQLAVSRGGTGAGTFTSNGVLLGNGTSALGVTAAGTANQVLRIPGGGGAPAFGAIELAQSAAVTGTLGVGNGGTGTGTTFTTGSIVFAGASGVYSQDNANFFWDDSANRLGIGNATPQVTLDVRVANATPFKLVNTTAPSASEGAAMLLHQANSGTVSSGHRLGGIMIGGASGTDYVTQHNAVAIQAFANQTWTFSTNQGAYLTFETTPNNSVTRAERMRIGADGTIWFGNGESAASPAATTLSSTQGSGTNITGAGLVVRGGAGTGTGSGGTISLQTALAGSSGASLNAYLTRMSVDSTGTATFYGNSTGYAAYIADTEQFVIDSLVSAYQDKIISVQQNGVVALELGIGDLTGSIGARIYGSGEESGGLELSSVSSIQLRTAAGSGVILWPRGTSAGDTAELQFRELVANGSNHSGFKSADSMANTITYVLPSTQPSTNQVLAATAVSGAGPYTVTLGWSTPSGGGITSLGGETGAIQTFANDTNVTISSATNTHTLGWTGQLAVSRGGTGAGTFTSNGVLLGNGTSAIAVTAAGTANQVLRVPGGGGAPAFGAIDLSQAAAVTGTLGVTNGGTGTATQFTAGSVVFAGASGVYSQNNSNLFWDNSSNRLGIGTATPSNPLHVNNGTSVGDVARFDANGYNTHQLTALGSVRLNTNGATAVFHTAAAGSVGAADTGGYTDVTATTNTGTLNITNGGTQYNRVYLGWYDGLPRRVAMYTGGGGTNGIGGTIQWEVWNGSAWTTTGVTGSDLTSDVASVVLPATATSRTMINGVSAFWIRGTVATAYSTAPIVRVSAVNFSQNSNAPWVGTGLYIATSALTSSVLGTIVTNQSTSQAALCIVAGGQGQQDIIQVYNFAGSSVWRVTPDGSITAAFSDNTFRNLTLNGGSSNMNATLTLVNGSKSQTSWLTDGAFFRSQAGTRTNSSTAASGTAATAAFNTFAQPTLAATNSSVTTTDAANVYIANAPAAGSNMTITNAYALWVDDGRTRLDGQLLLPTTGSSAGIVLGGDANLYRSAANALKTDDELVVGQRITTGVVVLTDGANIALDASLGNHFRVTLAGNRTLDAPTNAVDGQRITIEVIQDGGGNRTLTLTTGSSGAFIFGTDITAITLTTTGSKRDLIGCVYSSSLARWMVVSFIKGF